MKGTRMFMALQDVLQIGSNPRWLPRSPTNVWNNEAIQVPIRLSDWTSCTN